MHTTEVYPRPYNIRKIFEAAVHREQIKLNTGKVTLLVPFDLSRREGDGQIGSGSDGATRERESIGA